jgi:microcystin-dependent protein
MKENNWESENKELAVFLKNEIDKRIQNLIPIGTIQAFAMEKVPDGWLVCDGTELGIEAKQELFNVIGNAFGGDGVKTFCLPDLRGRFVRGWDMDGNIDPKRKLGGYQDDALQGHVHDINISALKINDSGEHTHLTYSLQKEYIKENAIAGNPIVEKIFPKIRELCTFDEDFLTKLHGFWGNFFRRMFSIYNIRSSGSHSHTIDVDQSKLFITDMEDGKFGIVRSDVETRPKNITLLYCIKV